MVDWRTVFIVIGFCLFPNLGGFVGSFITTNSIPDWYEKLDLPDWRPPNWLFAPVWIYLYTTMGLASYLVWRDGDGFSGPARWPLVLYLVQLALNWAWTPVFFGAKNLEAGFYVILCATISIWACGIVFRFTNKVASYLFIPYIIWVSFATCLNFAIWRRNLDA